MPTRQTSLQTSLQENSWPDTPGDTALTIHVPEADALVRTGSRAHVTVLYPFLPLPRITGRLERDLRALIAMSPAFTLTFHATQRWPGVLYLPPTPATPVRALTDALRARWPEAVPYRGIFGEEGLAPHLTLASGEGTDDIPASPFRNALPLHTQVTAVRLITTEGAGTGWRDAATYPLAPSTARTINSRARSTSSPSSRELSTSN
ncbi:2'-5' RNA ligase family protein [Streptomyces sp. NPDC050085]|uniref:2'-5' RNA ligase family protein n=1 Tax=Streptomyces sp. NPDC050085 TaxID=3365600 RepID=UPI0037A761EA